MYQKQQNDHNYPPPYSYGIVSDSVIKREYEEFGVFEELRSMPAEPYDITQAIHSWLEDLENTLSPIEMTFTQASLPNTLSYAIPAYETTRENNKGETRNVETPEVRYSKPLEPKITLTSFPAPEMYTPELSSPDSSVFADSLFRLLLDDVRPLEEVSGPDVVYLEKHKNLMVASTLKFAIQEALDSSINDDHFFRTDIAQLPNSRHHTIRARALLAEFDNDPLPTAENLLAKLMLGGDSQLAGPELGR